MPVTNIIRGGPFTEGAGAPTGTPATTPAVYFDSTAGLFYVWPHGGSAWVQNAEGAHPFTAAATAPGSPALGDHWYDTDATSKRLATYTADGWLNTSLQHVLQFNLADYRDQADPVAAALAAMTAAFATAPEPGAYNSYFYNPGDDPSARIELVIPPGIWGTLGAAYSVTVPIRFVSATGDLPFNQGGGSSASWLAGDFTFTGQANCTFQGLYLEGQHVLNSTWSFAFKDCMFVETSDSTERPNDNPFISVSNAFAVQVEGCQAIASGGARLRSVIEVAAGASGLAAIEVRSSWFYQANAPAVKVNRPLLSVLVEGCRFEGNSGAETAMDLDRVSELTVTGNSGNSGTFINMNVTGISGGALRIEGNRTAGPISISYAGSSDASAGPSTLIVTNNELNRTGLAVSLTTKGTGHAGSQVAISRNNLACDAAGKSVEITGPAVATSTNVVLTDNRIANAVAGQAPVVVNNMGAVHVRGNTVTTTGAAQNAIDVTNCTRAIVAENITAGGLIDTTGTTTSLVVNNI